jgi:hypothetical protein
MAAPFIFIGTHKVKPGRLEEFKTWFADQCDTIIEPNEPRLLSFYAYTDPTRTRSPSSRFTQMRSPWSITCRSSEKAWAGYTLTSSSGKAAGRFTGHPEPESWSWSSR